MQLGLPFHESAPPGRRAVAPARESPGAPDRDSLAAFVDVSRAAPTGIQAPGSVDGAMTFVRHRRARRYVLRVEGDGGLRVTIPRGGSHREAKAFVERQEKWIARQRARLTPPGLSPEVQRNLRNLARIELPARLLELAAQHGLTVTRISIRNQRTRWGSCGRNGHICLNWRLMHTPDWVRDYVLVHELMHLRRLDHSPQYWTLVAAACPTYQEARQWLRRHGRTLR